MTNPDNELSKELKTILTDGGYSCKLSSNQVTIESEGSVLTVACYNTPKLYQAGKLFLDIITGRRLGAVLTCDCDLLLWKIKNTWYLMKPSDLIRLWADNLESKNFDYHNCFNSNGYSSVGYQVPVSQLSKYKLTARRVLAKIKSMISKAPSQNEKQALS